MQCTLSEERWRIARGVREDTALVLGVAEGLLKALEWRRRDKVRYLDWDSV